MSGRVVQCPMSTPLPSLFVSHGSPMIALEPGAAGAFMQRLGRAVDRTFGKPGAIVAVSAHTAAREPVLLAGDQHHAVYDFGGFDPKLHTLRYDAPGAPDLAPRVALLLQAAGGCVGTNASGSTGMSASGHRERSAVQMPWSRPRSPLTCTGRPAACSSSATRGARSGAPGAS